VLEGLAVALSNVDEVIDLIKKAPSPAEAKRGLMERSWPSELVRAMIGDKPIQPYIGIGFVIHSLSNARDTAANSSQTVQDAVKAASSGGFLQMMGGVQLRFAKKGALFGQFQYSAQGRDFLLAGGASSFEVGLRWAFLPSKENDPTRRN